MTPYEAAIPPLAQPWRTPRVGGYDRYGNPQDTLDGTSVPTLGRVLDHPGIPWDPPRTPGRRRSVVVAVALAAVLGPLGLLYSSKAGALLTSSLFVVLTAPVCVGWALVASLGHNALLALRRRAGYRTRA